MTSSLISVTIPVYNVAEYIERFIEGGLYSILLMYGLRAEGLGACPLNLTIINDVETKFLEAANISSSEIPIMIIVVGHIPKN